jgi:hypothetical protein
MGGIKLPFLIEVWIGERPDGEGNLEPAEVRYQFNMDTPGKVNAFFDKFLKDSLNTTLNKHHFTDLDEYVKSQTGGSSLEDLELLANEKVWKQSRFCSRDRSYQAFMKKLRVGFENQLPSKTLEVQTGFITSLMNELSYNQSGHYPYFQELVDGSSPFDDLKYGDGGYFRISEFDDWVLE